MSPEPPVSAIIYRRIESSETAAVAALAREVFDQFVAPCYGPQGIAEFHRYAAPGALSQRHDAGHVTWVAEQAGGLVGMLHLREAAHVSMLFVRAAHQGSGIGHGLLAAAGDADCPFTVNASPNAVAAYQRLGFRLMGSEQCLHGIRFFPMQRLPDPPATLSFGEITLRFAELVLGDPARGLVPYYHFRMVTPDGAEVGHLNFRIGETEHVRVAAGHIGFEVLEPFRGHGYALQACRAVAPFVRRVSRSVTITCDPGNAASQRILERLGAPWMDEVEVPPHDPHYLRGSRKKRRYRWTP